MADITQLLAAWSRGDPSAFEALVPLVYDDLRRRAHHSLRQERPGHTLQTTGLVHEAYLRLVHQDRANWKTRAQFLAVASQVMRRVLVDHAREQQASKRGSGVVPIALDESIAADSSPIAVDVLALHDALERLAALDARQARIVELRYFAGLSVEDTAAALDISPATIKREWSSARAWLFKELQGGSGS
jgi:RNA polymerase sigma factor (TIGR02999 family)